MTNKDKLIERVASGLRNTTTLPDYFVFIEQPDYTWDELSILGIPVLHGSQFIQFNPWSDAACPFIPVFRDEIIKDESAEFVDGYISS